MDVSPPQLSRPVPASDKQFEKHSTTSSAAASGYDFEQLEVKFSRYMAPFVVHVSAALTGEHLADFRFHPTMTVRDVERALQSTNSKVYKLILNGATLPSASTLPAVGVSDGTNLLALASCRGIVATSSNDSTARIWNADTGKCLHVLQGHAGNVVSICFSDDGEQVITTSMDRTKKRWSVRTGLCEMTEDWRSIFVSSASFSPDKKFAVTGAVHHGAKVWNRKTNECVRTLWGHTRMVCAAAFAPDGTTIGTASADGTAKLWSAETGECLRTFQEGSAQRITSVAFSHDGGYLITGSADGAARIWCAATGTLEQVLEGHADALTGVAFAPAP